MKNLLIVAALAVSSLAFATPPPPAKAAPAAAPAAAGSVAVADCDMHKAEAAMMKDMAAAKVKMEMVKLDNGTTGIITTDAKNSAAVEKSMTARDAAVKSAMEGNAKLCDECNGMVAAMKSGKVMSGEGHKGMVWTHTMLSTDAETVKKMHAELDAKMAAAAPAAKK